MIKLDATIFLHNGRLWSKIFDPRMLTHDLFVAANLLVINGHRPGRSRSSYDSL